MLKVIAPAAILALASSALGGQLAGPVAAAATCVTVQPPVGTPFVDCSQGQVLNILPAGNNGLTTATETGAAANGTAPHEADQLAMYLNLKKVAPGMQPSALGSYYKNAGFSVPMSDIGQVQTFAPPHDGTYIIWDKSFGVPHIYGRTRPDTEFGVGYAAAHDRLFMMDALRHVGRSRLAQFIGPSQSAIDEDCSIAQVAGYSDSELTYQANLLPQRYTTPFGSTTEGQQVHDDGTNYVSGINAYISDAIADPANKMPVEYAALPAGQQVPRQWTASDVVAVATIVQSIFAVGGGGEVESWLLYKSLAQTFGPQRGLAIWRDMRQQNDPLAPTTLQQPFPYMNGGNTTQTNLPGVANVLASPGSGRDYVCHQQAAPITAGAPRQRIHVNLPQLIPGRMPLSNALLVDAAHGAGGHPVAVFGPQVAYFAPEILHEEDVHGPGIDARGASFPGTDSYVELGRGVDYAWSATSASSDLIDKRVEVLCNPQTGLPVPAGQPDTNYYLFGGHCVAMYERTDTETALTSGAAPGAPQVITFHIERTVHGPVIGRTAALYNGQQVRVAISYQRSTWFDELGSAPAFLEWNDPKIIHGAQSFMRAAAKETGTFNWHYIDSHDIAYYSSGLMPQRPSNENPNFPSWGTGPYDWNGFAQVACSVSTLPGPDIWGATTSGATTSACGYTAGWLRHDGSLTDPHPHAINPPQGFLVQWNNKPAPAWSAADSNFGFGSVYRVMSLQDRLRASMAAGPVTTTDLVNDMEDAGSVDLQGSKLIEPFLAALGTTGLSPQEAAVADLVSRWWANGMGAHRRAPSGTSYQYVEPLYADGNAVAVMDKLYPNLVFAIFNPWFGDSASSSSIYARIFALEPLYDPAQYQGLGSAYDGSAGGWESYVNTVLRQVLNPGIADAYSQSYCGTLAACRQRMKAALDQTIAQLTTAYGSANPDDWTCSRSNDTSKGQCNPRVEDIKFSAVGAQAIPDIAWINRPTFQQVVQFPAGRMSGG